MKQQRIIKTQQLKISARVDVFSYTQQFRQIYTAFAEIQKLPPLFQILLSHFDAFKFPSSEVVQFRALVTPCMPTCEPVQCDQEESTGELRSVISYGRRRRRRSTSQAAQDDLLLVQTIQITDKFGFDRDANKTSVGTEAVFIAGGESGLCLNVAGMIVAGTIFLAAQLAIIVAWTFIWQRKRLGNKLSQDTMSVNLSIPSGLGPNRTDSMCKLYEGGYPRSRRF